MAEYINRDDLLKAAWDKPTLSLSVFDIGNIKSVDVAPVRHAYWVPEEHADQVSPTTIHRYTWYYCSECGSRLIGYKNPIDAPYCHCGCKMDLEATHDET